MRITKLEHACLVVEEQGKKLIIDAGKMTKPLTDISDVVAVVVTHEHFDHFSAEQLGRIIAANPSVQIFATPEVSAKLAAHPTITVTGGDRQGVAPFTLAFYGEKHALIHGTQPDTHNVGVLVNDALYYPGDSFTIPDVAVKVLATPVSGPWLKIGEAIDFVNAIKPEVCFPTHDGLLSPAGLQSTDERLSQVVSAYGGTYHSLKPGDTLDI